MNKTFDMANLPNLLTYARIVAIPVIVALLLIDTGAGRWAALVLYALAAITDYLDGYLARKYEAVSPIGRMLDPIADKLLVGVLLIVFAYQGSFTVWDLIPAALILSREIFVSGLREFMGNENIVVHVSKLAKYKTTLQLVALGVVMIVPELPALQMPATLLLWATAVLTVLTGYDYWRGVTGHLRVETP